MSFQENVKQWVLVDNEMHELNEKIKELRNVKKDLTEKINQYVEETKVPGVKINDCQLRFVKVRETQQLTFKYLESCLSEIIPNEEQVSKIVEYIKNNRNVSYVPEIKRLYNN
jgi:hypothetical protein